MAARPSLGEAMRLHPVVLDGGLSTELERAGHDLSSVLWSARLLREDPDAVTAAHAAFFAAGAQVATTASYQATFDGFASAGVDHAEARRLMGRCVVLARRAAARSTDPADTWVAASVGPYGAMLADGSEYTGAYADPAWAGRTGGGRSVADLRAFHRERLGVLAEAGADVLACETIPAAAEAEALVAEVERLGVPAWISLSTVVDAAGVVRTRRGEPAADVFALAGGVDAVIAVGVNCTHPANITLAVREAAAASGKPVVVYPNSGERWDAVRRRWTGDAALPVEAVTAWVQAGARLVGGCCRVGPEEIRAIAQTLGQPSAR